MKAPLFLTLAITAALILPSPTGAQVVEPEPSITVTGEGKATAAPDMATVSLGVVSEAETAAAALEENNEAMQRLFQSLRELGIAKKDMQTSDFNVSPQYRHEEGKEPQIVGYQVTNQVQVKVRDLDTLGRLLDTAVNQGANRIHGISFSVSEPDKVLDEARREAVQDAQEKAQLYAEAAGVELGRLLSLDEHGGYTPQPRQLQYARMAAAEAVPIASGEEEFRVQVTLRYGVLHGGRD